MKLLIFFLILLASNTSFAYSPPAQFITKIWFKKHSSEKGIRIKSKISGSGASDILTVLTDLDVPAQTFRVQIKDGQGSTIFKFNKPISERKFPSLISSLLYSNETDPSTSLLRRWINPKTETRIYKKAENVVWLIGPSSVEMGNSIIFERDSFLPLYVTERKDGSLYESVLSNYKSTRDFMFPRLIEIKNQGAVIIKEEILDIQSYSDKKDTDNFNDFTPEGQSVSADVKSLISLIFKTIR